MSSLTSFTLFPELSTEMRLMIWRAARPGPRIVELRWNGPEHGWRSTAKPPAILHVNQESREEALKSYSLFFDAGSDRLEVDGNSLVRKIVAPERKIYFDVRVDTAYLAHDTFKENYSFRSRYHAKDFELLKSLAVDMTYLFPNYRLPELSVNGRSYARGYGKFYSGRVLGFCGDSLEKISVIRDIRSYNPESMRHRAEERWHIERCLMADLFESLHRIGGPVRPVLKAWKCKGLLIDGSPRFEEITDGAAWTDELYVGNGEEHAESDRFYDQQAAEEAMLIWERQQH